MRILIIDDDQDVLHALARMLQQEEHEADCVDNAEDALEKLGGEPYDFLLIDYKMPEHDGAWFMERAHIPRGTTPLLMTAHVNRDTINRMFELGVKGYLIKPFDTEDLVRHFKFHGCRRRTA